jgi:hypothetical protein
VNRPRHFQAFFPSSKVQLQRLFWPEAVKHSETPSIHQGVFVPPTRPVVPVRRLRQIQRKLREETKAKNAGDSRACLNDLRKWARLLRII